jgi:hypothetical protein
MAPTSERLAFDLCVPPLPDIVLQEKAASVIGFRADPELRANIEELARKSMEGQMLDDERLNTRVNCGRTGSSPFSNDKQNSARTANHSHR